MLIAYLGLGSNLGERGENIAQALELLGKTLNIERISSMYETEPMGYRDQPWFLNAVCCVSTDLDPFSLFRLAKEIEGELGRTPTFRNGPRIIDIDILFYGDEVVETEDLTIPHPRIAERPFVLVPLAEIAPWFIHPLLGKKIEELLEEAGGSQQLRRWGDVSGISSTTL